MEEKFPDIDIVQVGNFTSDMGTTEYESRLKNDDLTDIVMTWPLDIGREYWADRLLELSGMDFTSRYNNSMLSGISTDGKLYYVPGPAQVRGIVYNKTLFEENGWEVPSDYTGFVELCKTIEASGIRSLQLGFNNSEVLDTAFIGFNYGGFFSKPKDSRWLSDYNNGIGNFGDHFGPAFDVFHSMIDEGILKLTDLDINYSDRENILFSRKCAMVEDSVLMCKMGQSLTTDEFALMPFFNPDQGDWARLYMVCYVGMNKHLAEPENKAKYGTASESFTIIETGNFITDAMRERSGCDFVLFMDNGKDGKYNGKGVSARFYKGDITELDMTRVMPDLKSGDKGMLSKVTMTGADLIKTLENSITVEGNSGWFYYFSGFDMEYDPAAKQGERIVSIKTEDKKEIDLDATYSIALMAGSVEEKLVKSQEDLGVTVTEVVSKAIENKKTITPSKDGRFKIPEKK